MDNKIDKFRTPKSRTKKLKYNDTKYNKKNLKNNKLKNHKNHKNNKLKNNKNNSPKITNKKTKKNKMTGGSRRERFEVTSLNDFDFSKISISQYVNANIDWGIMPGPPPQPDCCIM